jgi:hypothetical protein
MHPLMSQPTRTRLKEMKLYGQRPTACCVPFVTPLLLVSVLLIPGFDSGLTRYRSLAWKASGFQHRSGPLRSQVVTVTDHSTYCLWQSLSYTPTSIAQPALTSPTQQRGDWVYSEESVPYSIYSTHGGASRSQIDRLVLKIPAFTAACDTRLESGSLSSKKAVTITRIAGWVLRTNHVHTFISNTFQAITKSDVLTS